MKILNKIRKKMFYEKNIQKYLVYAIGEILLVVFGILIALKVNNWNQKNIELNIEKEYLTSLLEDVKNDLTNFDIVISSNKIRVENLESLKKSCFNYDIKNDNDYVIMTHYFNCLKKPDFIKQTDRTLSQLKNSGGMRLIKNKKIIDEIIKYENRFEKLSNQQVWYEGGLKKLVEAGNPIFNYNYASILFDKGIENSNIKLLNSDKDQIVSLGNWTFNSYGFTLAYLHYLEEGKKECLELIKVLEENI